MIESIVWLIPQPLTNLIDKSYFLFNQFKIIIKTVIFKTAPKQELRWLLQWCLAQHSYLWLSSAPMCPIIGQKTILLHRGKELSLSNLHRSGSVSKLISFKTSLYHPHESDGLTHDSKRFVRLYHYFRLQKVHIIFLQNPIHVPSIGTIHNTQ